MYGRFLQIVSGRDRLGRGSGIWESMDVLVATGLVPVIHARNRLVRRNGTHKRCRYKNVLATHVVMGSPCGCQSLRQSDGIYTLLDGIYTLSNRLYPIRPSIPYQTIYTLSDHLYPIRRFLMITLHAVDFGLRAQDDAYALVQGRGLSIQDAMRAVDGSPARLFDDKTHGVGFVHQS